MNSTDLRRIIANPSNPKAMKEAALGKLRALEATTGATSVPYNSPQFSA